MTPFLPPGIIVPSKSTVTEWELKLQMRMERLDFADTETMLACHRVYLAAHETDEPDRPWFSSAIFSGWMRVGWNGLPREIWVARSPDGTVTGWFRLLLPEPENRERADLDLVVDPGQRRHGTGRELLAQAMRRATANGRSVLGTSAADGSPGEAFVQAAGAVATVTDVTRVQDLKALPPLDGPRTAARRAAAGYRLISWTGIVPEERVDGVATVFNAMRDAPRSPGSQPVQWDARRVREEMNDRYEQYGPQHGYSVAALAGADMAALTQVFVNPEVPAWGMQSITAVARPHRGHRLGLLVKLAMLDQLAEAEPQLEHMYTMNATANDHMIAVNQTLGYRVTGPRSTRWKMALTQGG